MDRMALATHESTLAEITAAMIKQQVRPIMQPTQKPKEENHEVKSPDV